LSELIEGISNADIIWEFNFAGLAPTFTGGAGNRLMKKVESPIPDLLAALSDPDKFVVAHVLLTQLTGIEYETFPTWNGLTVDIAAAGTVTIPSDQCYSLARRWQRWYQATPRPKKLPSDD
jgi:hypothetical protein